jgi:hypothetical protein
VRIVLITLNQVCRFAVRRGWLVENPVSKLEPSEKPHWTPERVAMLEGDELTRFFSQAGPHRPLSSSSPTPACASAKRKTFRATVKRSGIVALGRLSLHSLHTASPRC